MIPFAVPVALKTLPWKLIGLAALALFIGGLVLALKLERVHSAKQKAQIEKCAEARKADRAEYERGQAQAQADNLKHVRQIEQRQEEISRETVESLNARLERLRRELRAANPAIEGDPGRAGLSEGGNPASGADGEARLCLAPSEFLRAAESEERHDRLIDWVERQSKN